MRVRALSEVDVELQDAWLIAVAAAVDACRIEGVAGISRQAIGNWRVVCHRPLSQLDTVPDTNSRRRATVA